MKASQLPHGARVLTLFRGRPQSLLSQAVVMASSFTILGSPVWLVALLYYFYNRTTWNTKKTCLFGGFLAYLMWPKRMNVRVWKLWGYFYNYFSIQVILDDANALQNLVAPYMVAEVPHGIFPFGQAMSLVGPLSTMVFDKLRTVTVAAAFYVPFVRDLLFGTDSILADKSSIVSALRRKQNLMIIPGGIGEMFYSDGKDEVALLNNRKSFIKLAIENGAAVVPIYIFGNSGTFNLIPGFKYLESVSRRLQISFTPFYGRFLLPFFPNLLPLLYVVGRPLRWKQTANPTQKEVNAAHALFVSSIATLYSRYRKIYNNGSWKRKALQII